MELIQILDPAQAIGAVLGAVLIKILLYFIYGHGEAWRWSELKSMSQGALMGVLTGAVQLHTVEPGQGLAASLLTGLSAGVGWALFLSIKQTADTKARRTKARA